MQVLAKFDGLSSVGPLAVELGNEGARFDQRPVVLQPLLGRVPHRQPHLAVGKPCHAVGALGGDFRERTKEREFVCGALLVMIQHPFDLIDRSGVGARFELKLSPQYKQVRCSLRRPVHQFRRRGGPAQSTHSVFPCRGHRPAVAQRIHPVPLRVQSQRA